MVGELQDSAAPAAASLWSCALPSTHARLVVTSQPTPSPLCNSWLRHVLPPLQQLVTSQPTPSPLCSSWLRHVLPPFLSATAGYVTSYPLFLSVTAGYVTACHVLPPLLSATAGYVTAGHILPLSSLQQLVTSRPTPLLSATAGDVTAGHVLPPLLSATAGYVTSYPSPLCPSWLRHSRSRPTSLWLREKKRRTVTKHRGCENSVELWSHCLPPFLAPGLLTHTVSLDVEQHSIGCDVRSHAYQGP